MTNHANQLTGSCHCGNIRFVLHTNQQASDFVPRECSCSFCRRHGARYISDRHGRLEMREAKRSEISVYRMGHQTADFLCCKVCGVLTVATCKISGRERAVINVLSMPDYDFTAQPISTNFDGESVDDRLERREQTWTGRVVWTREP